MRIKNKCPFKEGRLYYNLDYFWEVNIIKIFQVKKYYDGIVIEFFEIAPIKNLQHIRRKPLYKDEYKTYKEIPYIKGLLLE